MGTIAIIELRYVRRRRPRFVVIGRGENEYVCWALGVFWLKTGIEIYDTLRASGYSFTAETEKLTWREAVAEGRADLGTYDLYIPLSSTAYCAEVMSARAAKVPNKPDGEGRSYLAPLMTPFGQSRKVRHRVGIEGVHWQTDGRACSSAFKRSSK